MGKATPTGNPWLRPHFNFCEDEDGLGGGDGDWKAFPSPALVPSLMGISIILTVRHIKLKIDRKKQGCYKIKSSK